ncbi:MAG TPA: sulfate ABC transporter substrate-binding protein [Polyangiales bacterium]|nr:sulfate ABC transporter substrate-binding protein [Polyangiales bacterium]
MTTTRGLNLFALTLVVFAIGSIAARNTHTRAPVQLLNVSYDPTRELYAALNPHFVKTFGHAHGVEVAVEQSHGGSSRQARSVISGALAADVVTLGLSSDVEALRKRGFIKADWASRLPNHSQPYYSTIVFVVRRGNPYAIRDWPDLVKADVEIIVPDPKSSGNGKLAALASWGSILANGGTDADAKAYLRQFYQHAPFLEAGARATSTAFAIEKRGDVNVAWENEALRQVAESKGELEIVYPPLSILAEPAVAWVDANVAKHKSQEAARAYLEYLFSDEAQEIIAQSGYRPFNPKVLERHAKRFPKLNLFRVTAVAKDWEDAQQKFFADNGIIDTVYKPKPR